MKKFLAYVMTAVLVFTSMMVVSADTPTDKFVFDTSIFAVRDLPYCLCMDSIILKLEHHQMYGVTFFEWVGRDQKMPPNGADTCFTDVPTTLAYDTVVFLNGVPNLSKGLFKYWEGFTNDVYIPDSVTEIDEECFVEGSTITLHFTANNAVALAYAQAHGMAYKIVPEAEEISEPSEPSDPISDPVSEPSSAVSIFDLPTDWTQYAVISCEDSEYVGMYHEMRRGVEDVVFFRWIGNMERVPSDLGLSCFSRHTVWAPTVVFWNGVPNFPKDLFKTLEGAVNDVYIPDSVTEIDEDCFVEGSHITIHFTKNNAVALAYAQTRGMAFEVMDGERVSGDVDFDKSVDMKDVLCLRKSIASLPAAVEIYSTDLNADGSTDMKDVLILRKQIATAA